MATYREINTSGSTDDKGVRTYQRTFRVVTDSYNVLAPAAWSIVPINRYDPYPGDSQAQATKVSCQLESDQQYGVYNVTYDYTSGQIDAGNSGDGTTLAPTQTDQSTTPTARPLTFKFGSHATTKLLGPLDVAGKSVVNSAGQPFDPPPEVATHHLTYSVTCFKPITFDWVSKNLLFQDAINKTPFTMTVCPGATTQWPKRNPSAS